MNKISQIGTGAVLASIIAATPLFALAHEGHEGEGNHGTSFSTRMEAKIDSVLDLFNRKSDNAGKGKKSENDDNSGIAFRGTVSANASSTLTVLGSDGKTYTVDTTGAMIKSVATSTHGTIAVGDIKIQDPIFVAGSETGTTTIEASLIVVGVFGEKVHDRRGKDSWKKFDGVAKGVVTSVDGNTITILNKKTGTTTVVTDSNTAFRLDGATTTSGSVAVGSKVVITGTTTATSTVSASIVDVFTKGFKKFVHVCFGWMHK